MKFNRKTLKKSAALLAVALGIILVFSAIDFFFHSLYPEYAVPQRYFPNKIIYGTLIGFISLLFLDKQKPLAKSLIFSAVVAILLQIRYFIEGYPLNFTVLFLFIHFGILLLVSSLTFRFLHKK